VIDVLKRLRLYKASFIFVNCLGIMGYCRTTPGDARCRRLHFLCFPSLPSFRPIHFIFSLILVLQISTFIHGDLSKRTHCERFVHGGSATKIRLLFYSECNKDRL
jgi:hypothetical protein